MPPPFSSGGERPKICTHFAAAKEEEEEEGKATVDVSKKEREDGRERVMESVFGSFRWEVGPSHRRRLWIERGRGGGGPFINRRAKGGKDTDGADFSWGKKKKKVLVFQLNFFLHSLRN